MLALSTLLSVAAMMTYAVHCCLSFVQGRRWILLGFSINLLRGVTYALCSYSLEDFVTTLRRSHCHKRPRDSHKGQKYSILCPLSEAQHTQVYPHYYRLFLLRKLCQPAQVSRSLTQTNKCPMRMRSFNSLLSFLTASIALRPSPFGGMQHHADGGLLRWW